MLTKEQQIFEQIKKAENILISFGKNWNKDGIASALALFLFLKKIGKKADIVAEENINKEKNNDIFSFLPESKKIKTEVEDLKKFIISLDISETKINQIKYNIDEDKKKLNFIISPVSGFFSEKDVSSSISEFKYDLIIVLDTPDLESLGKFYENNTDFFYKTPIINIDHSGDNEEFGQINHIELTSVSTAEILFSLFKKYEEKIIDEDIATCLLTGIISKTKSFKTANITPKTLLITSELISNGARREEIVNKLYRSKSINILKLWGRVLARLNSDLDSSLVWSVLTKIDFIKTGAKENDLQDVIDELIVNIPKAKIIVLIYENPEKTEQVETKFIVYSVKSINSLELIKKYNPEGTRKIAFASIKKPTQEVGPEIIKQIKEGLKKIPV
jgi:phosphoesterase RecJ-like protein